MRFATWMIGLSLPALTFAAQAQDVPPPPSDAPVDQSAPPSPPTPADGSLGSDSGVPDAAVTPAPPPPEAGPPPPAGAQVVMAPPSPVVQQTPQPPADYPKCSRTMKDECQNPGRQ